MFCDLYLFSGSLLSKYTLHSVNDRPQHPVGHARQTTARYHIRDAGFATLTLSQSYNAMLLIQVVKTVLQAVRSVEACLLARQRLAWCSFRLLSWTQCFSFARKT